MSEKKITLFEITDKMKNWGLKTPKQEKQEVLRIKTAGIVSCIIGTIALLDGAAAIGVITFFLAGDLSVTVFMMILPLTVASFTLLAIPMIFFGNGNRIYNYDLSESERKHLDFVHDLFNSKDLNESERKLIDLCTPEDFQTQTRTDLDKLWIGLTKLVRNGFLTDTDGSEFLELMLDWQEQRYLDNIASTSRIPASVTDSVKSSKELPFGDKVSSFVDYLGEIKFFPDWCVFLFPRRM